MSEFSESSLKAIGIIDKQLATYTSRLLSILDDQAKLGKNIAAISLGKFETGSIDDAGFLRSCGYKLSQEGLVLTSLIISIVSHLCKKLPPDKIKTLHELADFIHENIDPALHDNLIKLSPYRHIS